MIGTSVMEELIRSFTSSLLITSTPQPCGIVTAVIRRISFSPVTRSMRERLSRGSTMFKSIAIGNFLQNAVYNLT